MVNLLGTLEHADSVNRYMYYVVYTLGFIGIPFLYASEVAPTQLRAAVCGLSTAISWLFNFLVIFPPLDQASSPKDILTQSRSSRLRQLDSPISAIDTCE